MKLKTIFNLIVFLFVSYSYSQTVKFLNKDSLPNYEMMKAGKFVQEIKNPEASPGYYFVIQDSILTEFSENGKYFTKSKLTFLKAGRFKSVAYETTVPNYSCHLSEVVETRIIQTSTKDNLIKIRERIGNGVWYTLVLRKQN